MLWAGGEVFVEEGEERFLGGGWSERLAMQTQREKTSEIPCLRGVSSEGSDKPGIHESLTFVCQIRKHVRSR